MTIRKLKELIANIPDDARIYLDDGQRDLFDGISEIVEVTHFCEPYNNVVFLRVRDDFDVIEELEEKCEYYSENDIDEEDAIIDLDEHGYTPDDFSYDPVRYEWAKENFENYGLS